MPLIVIEGLDGSGKATQTALLTERIAQTRDAMQISFPDYSSETSVFVRMYLAGEFGSHADDVGAYTASSFYALDRYASFRKHWQAQYQAGTVILADRYVGSNLIYQMPKLPREEWEAYIAWLEDFEYEKLGLPRPDAVFYLDMQPQTSRKLLMQRYAGDESRRDLHERDLQYLLRCREAALYAAERCGWRMIRCCDGKDPYQIPDVAQAVWQAAQQVL